MGDVFGAASFVLTVVLGAVLLCSSVAISVEQRTFLLIALPYSVDIALIFIVSYDHAMGRGESIGFFVVCAIFVVLVILLGRHLGATVDMSVARSSLSQIQASRVNCGLEDESPWQPA